MRMKKEYPVETFCVFQIIKGKRQVVSLCIEDVNLYA